MKAGIETIPTKTSEAQRNTITKVLENRKEKYYNGIRIRVAPESKAQTSQEKYEDDLGEVKKIFQHLNVKAPVHAFARLEKPQGDKTSGIFIKILKEHHQKPIMLSVGEPKTYE